MAELEFKLSFPDSETHERIFTILRGRCNGSISMNHIRMPIFNHLDVEKWLFHLAQPNTYE